MVVASHTLERSVWSVVLAGWKLRVASDYVDCRKNKLRIGLSTRLHRHLRHLPAVAGSRRHGLP